MPYPIAMLFNPDFSGDKNQAKAVAASVALNLEPENKAEIAEFEENNFTGEMTKQYKIVVVSGLHGLKKADKIKQVSPNIFVVWSGHQYFKELATLTILPDVVALPSAIINSQSPSTKQALMARTKLVETLGVPHGITEQSIEQSKKKFNFKEDYSSKALVMVMLSGDAPDENGELKLFTAENARVQADLIFENVMSRTEFKSRPTQFLITNGPRTGAFDEKEQGINPHKTLQRDSVTEAFINQLQRLISQYSKQNKNEVRYTCFDFKYNQPSAYKPLLGLLAGAKHSLYFVPSESTSMVSESAYLVTHGKEVVAYRPSSEGKQHAEHLEDCFKQGVLSILSHDGYQRMSVYTRPSTNSAADMVALAAIKKLNSYQSSSNGRRYHWSSSVAALVAIVGIGLFAYSKMTSNSRRNAAKNHPSPGLRK